MSWRDFWNGTHSIYVSERHRALHYQSIAEDMARFVDKPDAMVLDHGCGEALSADLVARRCAKLFLFDAAPRVREKLAARFGADPGIAVLDDAGLAALPDHSLDLVVANSLAQYLSRDELAGLMTFWRGKLKPSGRLVLGDIIPPDADALADAAALLGFARRGGFFLKALRGLAATFFSDYRKLRQELGLTRYAEAELIDLLRQQGFSAARSRPNIGHNQQRMLFVATPL
jgi:SAM-dependent methyltransferase